MLNYVWGGCFKIFNWKSCVLRTVLWCAPKILNFLGMIFLIGKQGNKGGKIKRQDLRLTFLPCMLILFILSPFLQMKKDSPACGSWNISEEIRKVRSKATEEMLRTPPSSKIDWSSFALENKSIINPLVANEAETTLRDKVHNLAKPVGLSTSYGFPGVVYFAVLGKTLLVILNICYCVSGQITWSCLKF